MYSTPNKIFVSSTAIHSGRGFIVRATVSILLGLFLVTAAFAQMETGQIAGTVTDESGAVVPAER